MIYPEYTTSLGARYKKPEESIINLIQRYNLEYNSLRLPHTVDSIYGFSEACPLYGGRPYQREELSLEDIRTMYDLGIAYRIPIQAYNVTNEVYKESIPFLNKHHREGNVLIIQDDALAEKIRNDFPNYKIEASIIKRLSTIEEMVQALKLYDTIIPHQKSFDTTIDKTKLSYELIKSLRIYLCHGCIYNCDSYICYPTFSKLNKKGMITTSTQQRGVSCQRGENPREREITIEKYLALGITQFKMSLFNRKGSPHLRT